MKAPLVFNYLKTMNARGASDLYLTVGRPPVLRIDDHLHDMEPQNLSAEDVHGIVDSILTMNQRYEFESEMELNTSLDLDDLGRFRINIMRQRQQPALVIRRIISKIPSFDDLHLPKVIEQLSMEKRGLVLVTGMTGSGKSTSLASMVDYRNQNSAGHIITIEDPIEYHHTHLKSVITQREVGIDTQSYAIALKNALRQRPDVILVGEVRDREVMEQTLTAAETGHLCLATIHTNNAYQAIERVVNFFPEEIAPQIRLNLATNLKAVISQRLLPSVDGGLVPAVEVLLNQGFIRELIEKGEIGKMKAVMEESNTLGMQSYDQALLKLYQQGLITKDVLLHNADQKSNIEVKLQQAKAPPGSDFSQKNMLHDVDSSLISLKD